jgi:D-glycero-alpha-D-manno-heptose 1-phosphate guanylyltransferase
MTREAIILAGGFGTRLQSVVKDVPKPMAPIGDRPFLEFLLDDLVAAGFTKCILSVGYLHQVVSDHFGSAYKGVKIEYAIETTPLGTGGGLFFALKKSKADRVLVLNGDTKYVVNYNELLDFHDSVYADVTICLKKMEDTSRYGTVRLDADNRIIEFKEKAATPQSGFINTGVYLFSKSVNQHAMPESFSLEKDFFEPRLGTLNIFGFPGDGYFIDIGIPEDFNRAQNDLVRLR